MNTELLEHQLSQLASYPHVEAEIIKRFHQWLLTSEPKQRFRMNPYLVAEQTELAPANLIPQLLYAVKEGILDLHWDIHCPHCEGITEEHTELSQLGGISACPVCQKEFEADFASRFEVTFSLNPAIEPLEFSFTELCSLPNDAPIYLYMHIIGEGNVAQGETELAAGEYRYFCPLTLSVGRLEVTGSPTNQPQQIQLIQLPGAHFDKPQLIAQPGKLQVHLENHGHPECGLLITDKELPIIDKEKLPKRLTGLELIHYPMFRKWFRNQILSDRERISISAVTILFTDIKSSTQMYEKLGDALAYNIVRDHFEILFAAIEQQGGQVLKTIGDAVMASFTTNQQALTSILTALQHFDEYNAAREQLEQIYIKIGLHRGTSILVTLNGNLDYFGSTINKAARIQSLSGSREISFSEELYQDAQFLASLEKQGLLKTLRKQAVNLKGLEGEHTVYTVVHP